MSQKQIQLEISCQGICSLNEQFICTGCGRTIQEIEEKGMWMQRMLLLQSIKQAFNK